MDKSVTSPLARPFSLESAALAFPGRMPAVWLTNAAVRLALVSGVGYVAAAYTASRFLTKPRCRPLRTSPADFGLPFTELQTVTPDGVSLSGWLVEPAEPRGTVALFHGMRHTREQMLGRMTRLHSAGYRCVAFDHRAHGLSRGKRVSFGWYESHDVAAVAQLIADRWPEQPRAALGISMGAAALTFAGPACGWRGLVLEGIYAEIELAFRRRIGRFYPKWFGRLYPGIIWVTRRRLKVSLDELCPVDAVRALSGIALLLVTGTEDYLAPPEDARRLAEAVESPVEMLLVPGAAHNDVAETGGEAYSDTLLRFFDQVMRA
jgi:alpha-beta hydrolase superfamily lysophospholipase